MQLTLTADLSSGAASSSEPLAGYTLRPAVPADIGALGALYYVSYPAGIAGATVDEATDDVRASFDGLYGELWPDASLVAECGTDLVGSIQIVRTAPWDDVPPGPFIIELFTHPHHRRRGLARALLLRSLDVVRAAGESRVSLRVASDNTAAVSLYRDSGFVERR